jgi:[ribosomal protein S5]-alanine N-acetyltransferase
MIRPAPIVDPGAIVALEFQASVVAVVAGGFSDILVSPHAIAYMPQLTLFALDRDTADHLARETASCARQNDFALGPHESTTVAIAAATVAMLDAHPVPMPWGGYLALDGGSRRIVGTCGFKGRPDTTGAVELAYFTFPGEEGRGIASAMASELVQLAQSARDAVTVLRAHTLPEGSASCRVLEKAGFANIGSVTDPDDGPVWRWERPVRSAV